MPAPNHWVERVEHLKAVRSDRTEPVFVSVAATEIVSGDRFAFGGRVLTVTGLHARATSIVIDGEAGDNFISAEYLPFEAVAVQLPRPPHAAKDHP